MSRQRLWQLRRVAAGWCATCGRRRLAVGPFCRRDYDLCARLSRRKYRLRHGIPDTDDPVRPTRARRSDVRAVMARAAKRLKEMAA